MASLPDLPPELLQHIVDELCHTTEDLAQRRRDGRNLALSCKALAPFGTSLVYRELALRGMENDTLFRRVVGREDITAHVSILTYADSRSTPSPSRLSLLEQLLPACAALSHLHVYAAPSTINRLFGERGLLLPTTLTDLTLRSVPFLTPLDTSILATLAHFNSLRHLELYFSHPFLPSHKSPLLHSTLRIPLRSLSLAFPPSSPRNSEAETHLLSHLTSLFDPHTLVTLDLRIGSAEPSLLDWLTSLSSLRTFSLHLQHDTIDTYLLSLPSVFSSLSSLRELHIRQRVLPVPRPPPSSPASLAIFLASLPLALEVCDTSLFFAAGAEEPPLKEFLRAREQEGLRRFTCEVEDEGGGGRACDLARVGRDGGNVKWVEWVRLLFSRSAFPFVQD